MMVDRFLSFRLAAVVLLAAMGSFGPSFLITPAAAQDWTNWRGPEQSGVSREKNLTDDWSLTP